MRRVVEIELDSATTNPLIFPETGEFLLGGNFHGQPLALAADYLCMAAAELANISERRIERLVNPQLSGLPAFLVNDSGLNSGFMIAQYTAAALVSENKVLSHPACVDSIPTSANKEDHVSMGTISARKCRTVIAERGDGDRHRAALRLPGRGPPHEGKARAGHRGGLRGLPEECPRAGPRPRAVRDIETMLELLRPAVKSSAPWRRRWAAAETTARRRLRACSPGIPTWTRSSRRESAATKLLRGRAASQHEPGEGPKLRGVARQAVGLAVLVDLEEVLDPAEEEVVLRRAARAVSAGEDPRLARARCSAGSVPPQRSPGCSCACDELQPLREELHVAQPAEARLDVRGGEDAARRGCAAPPAQPVDRRRPPPRGARRNEEPLRAASRNALPERRVAGHRPRLQEGLQLPQRGVPAVVVEPGRPAVNTSWPELP